jgi:signal transduction histidine kinase
MLSTGLVAAAAFGYLLLLFAIAYYGEEVREKIFQPFFSSKPKGSGLGLAISQKIIEAHQGEIIIDSEPQKGTRVTIFLRIESQ